MKEKVDLICAHDIFINRQLIFNYPEQLLADKGVMAIEHTDFVTGGEIVSTISKPEMVKIGKCYLIEQVSSLEKILLVTIFFSIFTCSDVFR